MSILITGGAGFIGSNLSRYLAKFGKVIVVDNLSRKGSEYNLKWLSEDLDFEFHQMDIEDKSSIDKLIEKTKPSSVIHLAAQTAVTTSVADPYTDFKVNALGTFHVLDAVRRYCPNSVFIFASTNKVYGLLSGHQVIDDGKRYAYKGSSVGINETQPVEFHSPYGCSKGAADQYVLDYSRIYGLRSIVFRLSCIYGERQFGVEDQGWVSWFAIQAAKKLPVTIFGDGKQARDLLWIDDLLTAFRKAIVRADSVAGEVFNLGGGPENVLSLLELVEILNKKTSRPMTTNFQSWRPGDQRLYVSCLEKAKSKLDWTPTVNPHEGVNRLYQWINQNRSLFSSELRKKSLCLENVEK